MDPSQFNAVYLNIIIVFDISNIYLKIIGEMMEQYPNHQLTMVKPFQQHGYIVDRAIDMGYELNSDQAGCIDLTYVSMPSSNIGINYTITESSSDGELTPSAPRSFLSGN